MSETATILLERIDGLLAKADKSRYWLSKEATDGKSTSAVTEIKRGSVPREPRLRRIAEALETNVDYLMGRSSNPDPIMSEVQIGQQIPERLKPAEGSGIPLVGTGDCADLEVDTVEGEHVRIERSSFNADATIRYIERPAALLGEREAYAIYFSGSSMEPRFFSGEIGIVQPMRPASPGDYVLVQINDGESDEVVSVLVKRLLKQTNTEIVLEQHNPSLTFALKRRQVARMHRIVPPTDLLLR